MMAKPKAKYKNLKELAEAFNSGELSRDEWSLFLDNDSTTLCWIGPGAINGTAEFGEAKFAEGERLYAGGDGYSDLKEACEAAGIPCRWV